MSQSKDKQRFHQWRFCAVSGAKFLLDQWLLIAFAIACVLAYYFPNVAAPGGYIHSEYSVTYGCVALMFLINGLQLSPSKLRNNITHWRLHIIVQGMSFVISPAIVIALLYICLAAGSLKSGIPSISTLSGFLAAACLPTTIASNVVMTRAAHGDEAAAIISVIVGNVIGAFLSPILIYSFFNPIASAWPEFHDWQPAGPSTLGAMYGNVAKQLCLTILLPLLVGQLIRFWQEKVITTLLSVLHLAKVSGVCLVLIIWSTFSGAFKTGALLDLDHASLAFIIFINMALYILYTVMIFFAARPPMILARLVNPMIAESAFVKRLPKVIQRMLTIGQMSKEQTIAACFCGAAKTAGFGIPLVAAMWASSDSLTRAYIEIPVLLYTIEQIFIAQALVYFFRWHLERSKRPDEEERASDIISTATEVKHSKGQPTMIVDK